MERFGEADFSAITPKCYGDCFASSEILVFVGSCGIAVRKIAPYVHDKRTDPAVVCVDELGTFVIPLLSGPRMLMTRNLLYTAVTRAKACVCIVGLPETFLAMEENEMEQRRYSSLDRRLSEL